MCRLIYFDCGEIFNQHDFVAKHFEYEKGQNEYLILMQCNTQSTNAVDDVHMGSKHRSSIGVIHEVLFFESSLKHASVASESEANA